jgi:hypothetical protein
LSIWTVEIARGLAVDDITPPRRDRSSECPPVS